MRLLCVLNNRGVHAHLIGGVHAHLAGTAGEASVLEVGPPEFLCGVHRAARLVPWHNPASQPACRRNSAWDRAMGSCRDPETWKRDRLKLVHSPVTSAWRAGADG